jgi:hypothetical protein
MERTMTDEEEFFAWLDGELDGVAAARVGARVAADPGLAEEARLHRALGAQLRSAFDPLTAAPVPDRIGQAAVDFTAARERRAARRFAMPQWAAIAATLVVGVVGGTMLGSGSPGPVAQQGGTMVAAGTLEQALDTQLASAPVSSGVRIGLTFRDSAGALCRSFEDGALSGLACRDGDEWTFRGLFQKGVESKGDYRMAAGPDPRLGAMIDDMLAGEPLDAAGERAARANGWR